jgi:hypothetical protein
LLPNYIDILTRYRDPGPTLTKYQLSHPEVLTKHDVKIRVSVKKETGLFSWALFLIVT